jgi:hypothetical protein
MSWSIFGNSAFGVKQMHISGLAKIVRNFTPQPKLRRGPSEAGSSRAVSLADQSKRRAPLPARSGATPLKSFPSVTILSDRHSAPKPPSASWSTSNTSSFMLKRLRRKAPLIKVQGDWRLMPLGWTQTHAGRRQKIPYPAGLSSRAVLVIA